MLASGSVRPAQVIALAAVLCACGASQADGSAGGEPTTDDPGASHPADAPRAEIPTREQVPPDALTVGQALAVADDRTIAVVAWLWEHEPDCPPCPEGAECEACRDPLMTFGDTPSPAPDAKSLRVMDGVGLSGVPIGRRVLLQGQWSESSGQRVLVADAASLLP